MSNKIVPAIYRAVIDDVIDAIKHEFDEYGVAEDVLAELQHKWENKVIASHVADFETSHPPAAQHHAYPPLPMHMMQQHPHYPPPHNPYAQPLQPLAPPPAQSPHVKAEPVDPRYVLNASPGMPAYALPPLPGPQLNGPRLPHLGGQQSVLSFPPGAAPTGRPPLAQFARVHAPQAPPGLPGPNTQLQQHQQGQQHHPPPPPPPSQQPQQRIPQVDGPSSSSSQSSSPPPSQSYVSHPSLPQPPHASTSTQVDDPEAINSDLDDSDTEGEEDAEDGGAGETDIVFCTYDKVARVKNKWKCILKDGMIHINGRDYLFAKCTGEFEW